MNTIEQSIKSKLTADEWEYLENKVFRRNQKELYDSWERNPETSGGAFTQKEILEATERLAGLRW